MKNMNAEYFKLFNEYTLKYGKKTAIMMQIGSFFELLDEVNITTGDSKANVREISGILGLQLSIKRNETIDELMCGIPEHTLHRWASKLTEMGWTVIVVTQKKGMNGKILSREVSRILSPGSHVESFSSDEIPYVYTIIFTSRINGPPLFGVAALDLTTGKTYTYSGTTQGHMNAWTAHVIVQMMSVFSVKEVIVYSSEMMDDDIIRRQFQLPHTVPLHRIDSIQAFSNQMVRMEYIQRIITIRSLLPPRTYLGLRTEEEEYALCLLLTFAEEHFPEMVRSLHRNEPWNPNERLICGGHSLSQLQMIGTSDSVVSLFNKSITPMGRRGIHSRMTQPHCNPSYITKHLSEVTDYLSWPESQTVLLERQLRFIYDLPRLHRKLLCALITPNECTHLLQSYRAMDTIQQLVTKDTSLAPSISYDIWSHYLDQIRIHMCENKFPSADQTVFNIDTYPDIGIKEAELTTFIEEIHAHRQHIALMGGIPVESIRIEEREREPFAFKCSSMVIQQLKKKSTLLTGITFSELKSGGWVDTPILQQYNGKIQRARDALQNMVHQTLPSVCISIAEEGRACWSSIESWIENIDVTQNIARVSKERGYSCPTIDVSTNGSWVEIQQMRHPIVETLCSKEKYVAHDVSLGVHNNGYLLYGLNSVGKTVCSKAVGICVLLAQAGCFVPAHSMTLCPFNNIYTRLISSDDLVSGLSTFGREMAETREMLQNATPHTLIIGDEPASGTESTSALSIVATTIKWLSERHSKFIFTTHLHGLPALLNLKKERVQLKHLHVEYDPVHKKLIYDRILRDGQGSSLYGVEVARFMDLPYEFIEQALSIRHQILGTTSQMDAKSSAWNSSIIRRMCEVCQSPITKELEVHHVMERHTAINGILPDGTPMNAASNLIVLCQSCHDKIHSGNMKIGPLHRTSSGPERVITEITPSIQEPGVKKSKWSEEEWELVKNTLRAYSSLSLKSIRAYLSSTYSIDISETVLRRARKDI